MPDLQSAVVLLALAIAPLGAAGLTLINAGLGRSRNAAHSMMAALCGMSVAVGAFFVLGHSLFGFATGPSRVAVAGGTPWDWVGALPPFFAGLTSSGAPALLSALMGMEAVALAALIPLGSGGERWRLGSICASTAFFGLITFPVFGHWTWGGGWLARLGYLDTGGAGVIHAAGGLTALSAVWLLGPRRGKYSSDGMPMAMPAHNVVFVLFGCLVAAIGWFGMNAAGSILFTGVELFRLPLIAINLGLSASGAGLAAALVTKIRFGRPDASLTANGWVGGLVAASSGCAWLPPASALLTGLIAGILVTLSVELLELRLDVDDPGGSVSVHAVAGIWGLVATGMFGRFAGNVLLAQVVGVATLLGFVLPLSWLANAVLNRFLPMRVSRDEERQGLDLAALGAGAYPDFVTHTDDFLQR